ncbi:MAG: Gfo/Idh/MocA family oxidoreductase [Pedosphaera sp.]|nr:Gfo/Idh/MocA family oxidoreductase [Pedosphaera sp.]MSU44180.1 Gfo/Idh/MocA family oxidoreductase [Pedosphaera sp.]
MNAPPRAPYRAAIIGHTGAGDYGHGLDTLFNGRADVRVVAVADPDAAGRARVARAANAPAQYADYRQMLAKEKPELISLGPRWTEQRLEMGLAALRAGAHVFMDKPFMPSLAEADTFVTEAEKRGLRCALALPIRLEPGILFLKQQLAAGRFGEMIEMHLRSPIDPRVGGEDLVVHGPHLFDLLRFFAGDAAWCTARILHQGRDATKADAKPALREKLGLVLGDDIHAQFTMPNGVHATYVGAARYLQTSDGYGFTMVCQKAVVRVRAGYTPVIEWRDRAVTADRDAWKTFPDDPRAKMPAAGTPAVGAPAVGNVVQAANTRLVDDWLVAIANQREPAASAQSALRALEMIQAIVVAGLRRERVSMPLRDRAHPLSS